MFVLFVLHKWRLIWIIPPLMLFLCDYNIYDLYILDSPGLTHLIWFIFFLFLFTLPGQTHGYLSAAAVTSNNCRRVCLYCDTTSDICRWYIVFLVKRHLLASSIFTLDRYSELKRTLLLKGTMKKNSGRISSKTPFLFSQSSCVEGKRLFWNSSRPYYDS